MGLVPDEAAIAEAMPKAHIVFNELSRQLGGGGYFVGDKATLADILVAPHLGFLAQTPEWASLTEASPNLVSWLHRMEARPSFKATTRERLAELAKAA
jgi:glutathione S-transferase